MPPEQFQNACKLEVALCFPLSYQKRLTTNRTVNLQLLKSLHLACKRRDGQCADEVRLRAVGKEIVSILKLIVADRL